MINELYNLSETLEKAKIQTQNWHRKYRPIPNIREKTPCVCITFSDEKVMKISSLDPKYSTILRKYGSNQGSYPCMNLASLYRVTEDPIKKELNEIADHPEKLNCETLEKIKGWCTEYNWGKKFQGKYKISMENTVVELQTAAARFEPLQILIDETKCFSDASRLHKELESVVWKMLSQREHVKLALAVLFYQGKSGADAANDYGSLSVALESAKLIEAGIPAVSDKFVTGLNACLLEMDFSQQGEQEANDVDAFGNPFQAIEEPMPGVKLAGGFDVTIRTMFKEQYCQNRYGKIENASYPISPSMRVKLQASLEWIGKEEQRDKTWMNLEKNEILFVYPFRMPQVPISFTNFFGSSKNLEESFTTRSEKFVQELIKSKDPEVDSQAKWIQIFILRKIDKARTKVVYTRQTNPYELEACSEAWNCGCKNLPRFPFGEPVVLEPLDTSDVLNRFWKANGEMATDRFHPVPRYRGLELLLEPTLPVTADLHTVLEKTELLSPFLGNLCAKDNWNHSIWKHVKNMVSLLGILLYREDIRKEDYMENVPYLYGQLLKTADELHALYCNVVRKGDFPPQFLGSGLYRNASETPARTLNILSQRIMPYYAWAKSYRYKERTEPGKESWRAAWLYHQFERIMNQLREKWTVPARFNEEEKAQLFIGYLAAFSKKEESTINEEVGIDE